MNNKTDKKANVFKAILTRACCIFTPVILVLYSIGELISNAEKSFIPTFSTVAIILVFSIGIALSSTLYKLPKLSFALAHIINFFLFGIFYYFVVVVMRKMSSDGGYTLVAMVFYALIFAIVTLCIIGINGHKKKKINDMKNYESKF